MRKIIILSFIALLFTSSCGIFKKKNKDKGKLSDTTVMNKVNAEVIAFADTLKNYYTNFKYFQTKLKISYKDDKNKQNIKGSLRLKKDSFIWISARALGFEVARFLLTPDSVKFMNKMKSEYFKGDYSFIEKNLNIKLDFQTIQSILINELFVLPKSKTAKFEGFELFSDSTSFVLKKNTHNKNMPDSVYQGIKINKSYSRIINSKSSDSKFNRVFEINYSDFNDLANSKFPFLLKINIKQNKKNINLNLIYYKLKLDKSFSPSFRVPASYKQIKN